jgi:hypothetical protein
MKPTLHEDRRAILSLVAMGRITAREAESLLALWPDGEDAIVRLALCLGFAVLTLPHLGEWFSGFTHVLTALTVAVHHALACVIPWFGGLL